MPQSSWHAYEPIDTTEAKKGAELAFGAKLAVRYRFEKADRILGLDSDFLGAMNIGNPDEHTVLDVARAVLELTGSRSEITFEPLPADDPKQRRPDIGLARRVLGWRPRVDLREGLARTHDWYRRAGGES